MASWTGNPEIWTSLDLQLRTWPRIFPFSLVKWSTDAVLGKAPSGPVVLLLLDLCPGREVGRYLHISGPFLAPSPARAASDGKRVALSPFHMRRAAEEPWESWRRSQRCAGRNRRPEMRSSAWEAWMTSNAPFCLEELSAIKCLWTWRHQRQLRVWGCVVGVWYLLSLLKSFFKHGIESKSLLNYY